MVLVNARNRTLDGYTVVLLQNRLPMFLPDSASLSPFLTAKIIEDIYPNTAVVVSFLKLPLKADSFGLLLTSLEEIALLAAISLWETVSVNSFFSR